MKGLISQSNVTHNGMIGCIIMINDGVMISFAIIYFINNKVFVAFIQCHLFPHDGTSDLLLKWLSSLLWRRFCCSCMEILLLEMIIET